MSKIKDYEFQTQCVEFLIEKTVETTSKQVITVKAPTGAGKTIILIKYVDEFLKKYGWKYCFCMVVSRKGQLGRAE
ncbi:MAG: DEAD/DEAH box helicase family protein [Clostridium sp.]